MIYLSKGTFAPAAILVSIVFAPILIAGSMSFFGAFQMPVFIAFVACLVFYCVGILLAYKNSKSKKYAMQVREGNIIINYPNINKEQQELVLHPDEIVKIEYYRLCSIRAWVLLQSYLLPQCVFLTYVCDGQEICKHIGYPDYQEILNLCRTMKIDLINK